MSQQVKQKTAQPIHRIRISSVGAAIFKNTTEEGQTYYNVQFTRSYRSGDGWKHTRSFSKDDLLVLAKLSDQVHTWINEQQQTPVPNPVEEVED